MWHNSILVSKVRSLQPFQGDSNHINNQDPTGLVSANGRGPDDDFHRTASVECGLHCLVRVFDVEVMGDYVVKRNSLVMLGQRLECCVVAAGIFAGDPNKCQVSSEQIRRVHINWAEIDERSDFEKGAPVSKEAHRRTEARRMSSRVDNNVNAVGNEVANSGGHLGGVFGSDDAVGCSQIRCDVEPCRESIDTDDPSCPHERCFRGMNHTDWSHADHCDGVAGAKS